MQPYVTFSDHYAPSFVIIVQRVNHGAQRREIVHAEQRATRRGPLEVVHRAPIGPCRRKAPQGLGIHLTAHHGNEAHVQVGMDTEDATQPRVEGVRHLNKIIRL